MPLSAGVIRGPTVRVDAEILKLTCGEQACFEAYRRWKNSRLPRGRAPLACGARPKNLLKAVPP